MLRKTTVALSLYVFLCGLVGVAVAWGSDYEITVSEAPSTYEVISPTSTRWVVKRDGRLVPISALRAKYFRVSTYHTTPFPANTVGYHQTVEVVRTQPQYVPGIVDQGYAPGTAGIQMYPPQYAPSPPGGAAPSYIPAPGAGAVPGGSVPGPGYPVYPPQYAPSPPGGGAP